jgi:hypothetical protein
MILDLTEMTKASFLRPAAAAQDLFILNLDRKTVLAFLGLGVVLSVISMVVGTPDGIDFAQDAPMVLSPIGLTVIIYFATLIASYGIYLVGRMMQGQGSLDRIILVMAWIQWLQFLMQLFISVILFTVPAIVGAIQFAVILISIWIFLHMVDQAHGFDNLWTSLLVSILGNLVASVLMAIPLAFILAIAGVFSA